MTKTPFVAVRWWGLAGPALDPAAEDGGHRDVPLIAVEIARRPGFPTASRLAWVTEEG